VQPDHGRSGRPIRFDLDGGKWFWFHVSESLGSFTPSF